MNRVLLLLAMLAGLLSLGTTAAFAGGHNFIPEDWGDEKPLGAYDVAAIEHSNLVALENNGDAIMELALRLTPHDDAAMTHARHVYLLDGAPTLWGMLPGWTDAESPIHVNMHDKQATTFALLTRLQTLLPGNTDVAALAAKVDADRRTFLTDNPGYMSVCRVSQTGFSTDRIGGIEWQYLLLHGPSLMAVLAAVVLPTLLFVLAGLYAVPWLRRRLAVPATPMWQPAPLKGNFYA